MHAAAYYAAHRCTLGTITPSGNTVVERVTIGVARELPEVSVHFSRTPVFGSSDPSPDRYAGEGLLAAARLLAHAQPQALVWNGSKGATIGVEHDRALAAAIEGETGIRTTTSILGLYALARARGWQRVALVTPYSESTHRKTIEGLAGDGLECVADAYGGLSDNLSYASMSTERIGAMVREVAAVRPQAVLCLCTNFPAAVIAAPLEAELGLPVIDSTALGVWHALRLAGVDTSPAALRWGSLFEAGL